MQPVLPPFSLSLARASHDNTIILLPGASVLPFSAYVASGLVLP